ncbi:hypothetical protein UFOVP514_40 [uncultured Caudovirales phage]|uniref:Uncharacterized protein n=1 Tax=uncultured Caudovirales phage TaxID=2100421 RepID=A0A6J5MVG6_9CAUD|nr:hypothetical protein UFOVP514_40 [uncultured Caudovirales phage]
MRYQDEQQINELEKLFQKLIVLIAVIIFTTIAITVLTVKGCSNTIAPVHFKENYTPTKFNKL